MIQVQSIDGAYYTSAYFWVTTALIIIGMGVYWWRNWDKWEIEDAQRKGYTSDLKVDAECARMAGINPKKFFKSKMRRR